ncbi:hypothetical protein FE257_011481 [Aspergillus nanangensis]|uniref:Uncharacterized protein n=1 Tax=Aspergillus nanangensis TaxID=2582783 RepID=A0AAD4CH93_ASPNN|nr:hypothetical protein FE257_011481 [Aspergillus nanangensis]
MRCSSALTALTLSVSALAVPLGSDSTIIANVEVIRRSDHDVKDYQPNKSECVTYPNPDDAILRIAVSSYEGSNPKCVFYREDKCAGQAWSIEAGTTIFNTDVDFKAGSFSCDQI